MGLRSRSSIERHGDDRRFGAAARIPRQCFGNPFGAGRSRWVISGPGLLRLSGGLLLAVPDSVSSQEALASGLEATQDDQPLGQSIVVTVPGGTLTSFNGTEHPDPLEDAKVDVLLVDVSSAVATGLNAFNAGEHPMDLLHTFNVNIRAKGDGRGKGGQQPGEET